MFITTTTSIPLGINKVSTFSYFLIMLVILKREVINNDFIFINKNRLEIQYIFLILLIFSFEFLKKGLISFLNIFNTLLFPIILLLFLLTLSYNLKKSIVKLILFFFVLQCCLAIFERTFNVNIFPENIIEGDVLNINIQYMWEFRSSSFWGNPLMNANIVSIILSFIIISKIDFKVKLLFYLLGIFALFSFNARGAILMWAGLSIPFFWINYIKISARYKATYIIGILVIVIFMIIFLINSNWSGRLFNQQKIIDGSAITRIKAIDVFNLISIEDLFFGTVNKKLYTENGFINIIFSYGLIQGALIILFQILITFKHINRYSLLSKIFIFLSFIGVGMLNNNLYSSTPFLFFILCVSSFQPIITNELRENFSNHPII